MMAVGSVFLPISGGLSMVLKSAFAAALCTGLLMVGGPALADEYRPGELFGLDLSRAVLSPKRLGPETEFAPVPIEARTDKQVKTERVIVPRTADRKSHVEADTDRRQEKAERVVAPRTAGRKARVEADTDRKQVKAARAVVPKAADRKVRVVQERVKQPRAAARTEVARRQTNPLDAQARDTRIQTWPCQSGGICNWQR
jgi:hypothetical protein